MVSQNKNTFGVNKLVNNLTVESRYITVLYYLY